MSDDQKKRILMISNQGGYSHIQTHIYYIARILKNKGHQVEILSPENGSWAKKMQQSGYPVHHFKFLNKGLKKYFALYNFFKENKYDIIHSHSVPLNWVIPASICCKKALKIHTFHTGRAIELGQMIDRMAINKLDKIITITINQQKLLVPFQIPRNKLEHISYGISERFFINNMPYKKNKYRKNYNIKERGFLIGTLGRFEKKNGFDHLIEMMEVLRGKVEAKCVIVGDGNQKKEFKSKIAQHGLEDQFILAGYCDKIYEIFPAFDLLVIPYINSDYSIIPLESMACGLPVVAFSQPYLDELSEEFEGIILVPNKNGTAMAHQVRNLYQNEKELHELSLSSYLKAQNYHQELMIKKLSAIYDLEIELTYRTHNKKSYKKTPFKKKASNYFKSKKQYKNNER